MAAVTKHSFKKRRRGLIFAELLRCTASAAPDEELRREVERLAGSVDRRFGFSDAEKKEAVMTMVLDGAQTVNDLVVETGFRPQDVLSFLHELKTDGRVRLDRRRIHSTGRPSLMAIPIEVKSTRLK
jgi:predicted Rossmann fold nucleotide-binding protein DprA/Smf involved in DNA uptake